MNYELLLKDVEAFVSKYMRKHDDGKLLFHKLANTQNIVEVANEIAAHYPLSEEELFTIRAAAWFLYIGYYKDSQQPEEASAKTAEEFLKNAGVESDITESVRQCILATIHTGPPASLPASIICDANTFYLSTENFPAYNKLRRKESALVNKISIDKNEWKRRTIQGLESHQYYTDYCKNRLAFNKQRNLERLQKKNPLLVLNTHSVVPVTGDKTTEEESKNREKETSRLSKKNSSERTIETMFRTTSANSQRLSSQADTKAHIMISVNTIIISLMLGLRQLAQSSKLTIPVIMLLIVNLVTIIFSILATRPNVAKRKIHFKRF